MIDPGGARGRRDQRRNTTARWPGSRFPGLFFVSANWGLSKRWSLMVEAGVGGSQESLIVGLAYHWDANRGSGRPRASERLAQRDDQRVVVATKRVVDAEVEPVLPGQPPAQAGATCGEPSASSQTRLRGVAVGYACIAAPANATRNPCLTLT
jgi:hypothetical protein